MEQERYFLSSTYDLLMQYLYSALSNMAEVKSNLNHSRYLFKLYNCGKITYRKLIKTLPDLRNRSGLFPRPNNTQQLLVLQDLGRGASGKVAP